MPMIRRALLVMATLATFFAGRGQTRVVLAVNVISTAADIVLDALWIFGRGGFPRWGVAGLTASAGIAGWVEFVLLRSRLGQRVGRAPLSRRPSARTPLPVPRSTTLFSMLVIRYAVSARIGKRSR